MAPRIQRLMQERQESLGEARTPSDRVTVEPDPVSNSLIVASSDENLVIVEDLVELLVDAEAGSGDRAVEVVNLESARAADVVRALQDLYVEEANRTRGQNLVRVTADDSLNAVLLSAPPADAEELRALIAQLDGARPATVVEIKYVPLDSANALETVSLIEEVLSGRGIGARRGSQQATVIQYLREVAREEGLEGEITEVEVSSAIRESIMLTPDVRTNTIIVSAPKQSIGLIEQMIHDLDASNVGAKNIRIFKLANADATAMAQILTDLFNLRQGNQLLVLKPRDGIARDEEGMVIEGAGSLPGLPELTAVPDPRQSLSITVDTRTNSLLVSGTPNYLDLVETVVLDLDAQEANEREVITYQLRNSEALEVARVIGEFVDEEQRKLVETIGMDQIGSAARLLEREITIVGDEKSNTVLVSASPRYVERMREMIEELDIDPPQVLIQVLLAEVTLDRTLEWGFDSDFDFDVGSTTISGGYGFGPRSALLSSLGVPSISVATADFNLMLRALEDQGRLQVLSNPSVMAANNEPARIQIGEEVGRALSSTLTDGGNQQTDVEYVDTGVILEVTPSINPEGFVRMTVAPEITDLTNRTTQVSETLEVPIFTKRTADTTVTVRDGQTIVLGGLISDRYEDRERKVPLLGDIPIIGLIFRSERRERAKTELLIVLTPHVIHSPSEISRVDGITWREIERMSLSEEDKEALRQSFIRDTGGLDLDLYEYENEEKERKKDGSE
jgi:type II secretion system protein D